MQHDLQQIMVNNGRCSHANPPLAAAAGADFGLVAPRRTMLPSRKPVVAVCAVRTGCGKSQVSRYLIDELAKRGKKCVLVRHPMVRLLAARHVHTLGS